MMLALLEQASDFERQTMFHLDAVENEINVSYLELNNSWNRPKIQFQPAERLNYLRRAKEAAKNMGDKGVEELLSDMVSWKGAVYT